MPDVCWCSLKIKKIKMISLKLQTFYRKYKLKPMVLWTKDKSLNLSSIKWRLCSRRRTMLDFISFQKRSMRITSTMMKLQISRLSITHIKQSTSIMRVNFQNAQKLIRLFGKHLKLLKKWFLRLSISTFLLQ